MNLENETLTVTEHETVEEIFTIVKKESGEVVITIGNTLISGRVFESLEEAKNWIKERPYELLLNLMCFTAKFIKDEKDYLENAAESLSVEK